MAVFPVEMPKDHQIGEPVEDDKNVLFALHFCVEQEQVYNQIQ